MPSRPSPKYALTADQQAEIDALRAKVMKRQAPLSELQALTARYQGEAKRVAGLSPEMRLAEEYQAKLDAANAANEARYQEGLKLLEGQGAAEAGEIRGRYQARQTAAGQDLVSRGLAASTVAPTTQNVYERALTSDLGALGERINRQRLGWIEGKEEIAPDWNQMLTLAQMAGRGSGAYGGGAYGGGGGWGGGGGGPSIAAPGMGLAPGAPMGINPAVLNPQPDYGRYGQASTTPALAKVPSYGTPAPAGSAYPNWLKGAGNVLSRLFGS